MVGLMIETAKAVIKSGASILVAGSYIFKNPNGIKEAVLVLQWNLNKKIGDEHRFFMCGIIYYLLFDRDFNTFGA